MPRSGFRTVQSGPLQGVMFIRFRPRPARVPMPDICCDLWWVRERLVLAGPASCSHPMPFVNEDVQLLNIDPLVARAWLGVPLNHLVDRRIALDDINRDLCGPVAEMFHSGQAAKLVRPVAQRPSSQGRLAAAAAAVRRGHPLELAASRVGISSRQLERVFLDQFGLAPRTYRGITRVRRALEAARAGRSLADAALSAGYADQSHFTREVRAFMGESPRAVIPNVGNVQDAHAYAREY